MVVIGGGQAGLAAAGGLGVSPRRHSHLRRLGLDFVILDARTEPGGAWQHTWNSLRLFSPAAYSSLPGRLMPAQSGETCPDAQHVVDYLAEYEKRYELPVERPVRALGIHRDGQLLRVETDFGTRAEADTIIWCTGFRPALSHLAPLQLHGHRGHIATEGTRTVDEPRVHLLGYGDWTGPASATLIGGGRPARDAAREVAGLLRA